MSQNLISKVGRLIRSLRVLLSGILYTAGILKRTRGRKRSASTKWVKDQFEHEASIYDASRDVWVQGYRGEGEQKLIAEYLQGNSVLELGTGTGRVMTRFAGRYDYYGIDVSYQMLKKAKDKASVESLDVELLVMDGEHLGFRHGAFDSVITSRTLKYLQNPSEAMLEAKRTLRTNGRCIVSCETCDAIWHRILARGSGNFTDIRFGVNEILGLLRKAGFSILGMRPMPSLLSPYYGSHKLMQLLDKMLCTIRTSAWVVIGESNVDSCGTEKRETGRGAE